jgi:hypothetical protein
MTAVPIYTPINLTPDERNVHVGDTFRQHSQVHIYEVPEDEPFPYRRSGKDVSPSRVIVDAHATYNGAPVDLNDVFEILPTHIDLSNYQSSFDLDFKLKNDAVPGTVINLEVWNEFDGSGMATAVVTVVA